MSEKKKKSSSDERFSRAAEPQRAETRRRYKEMNRKLEHLDVRDSGVEASYEVISQVIQESNQEITKRHVTPHEMRMDAALVKNTAKKYSDILDGLVAGGVGGQRFEAEEFGSKLCYQMCENSPVRWGEDNDQGVCREDWMAFAKKVCAAFSAPMTTDGRPLYFQTIGIQGSEIPNPTAGRSPRRKSQVVAAPKQLQQKPAAPPPKPTRLREIKPDKEKSETDKNMQIRMEVCRDVIKEAIRNSGYHPIHYLELVADPTSYENTVRNMFTVSFLLNRSEVGLVFDRGDQPYLYIVKDKHKLKDREDHPKLSVKEDLEEESVGNWISSITPEEWREIIELYSIKEPMLPALHN